MAALQKLSKWNVFWECNRLSKDLAICVFKRKLRFHHVFTGLDLYRYVISLRLVFIVFPDYDIAAPVNFFSVEEASTYIHHNI